jgi:murein DD-endopeptidase MepM/ murein hydrolase activator NlpD
MIKNMRIQVVIALSAILLVTLSCSPGAGRPQSAADTPAAVESPAFPVPNQEEAEATDLPEVQPPAEATAEAPAEVPAEVPTEATAPLAQPAESNPAAPEDCEKKTCFLQGSFLLARPIGPDGRFAIDTSSRYGTINKRTKEAYFGVQFLNSTGVPVLAAADGTVVAAGDDSEKVYAQRTNTYGMLVILQHNLPGISEPVYTLYSQLSEIAVKVDDVVNVGQEIGKVGATGSVRGSTLHFEVRMGKNAYEAARNPELWLALLPDVDGKAMGTLAGRVMNAKGTYVHITNILIENLRTSSSETVRQLYLKTYLDRNQRGNAPWEESFATSNLPEGTYQISFWYRNKLYQREVEVQPGMLTFVTFRVK